MNKVVIVCKHVLDDPACVRCAFRTEPVESSDSGWQILCGADCHSGEEAKVLSEDEVKNLIPSVASIWESKAPCMFVFDGKEWAQSHRI